MITFFANNLLWSEGLEILVFLALVFVCGVFWWRPLVYAIVLAFFGCLYFFRNPERVCERALHDDRVLICPSDGVVIDVQSTGGQENSVEKSAEYMPKTAHTNQYAQKDVQGVGEYAHKIAIFLSVRDVHVNWISMSGVVEKVAYTPGTFLVASMPESSLSNEHNEITIVGAEGRRVCVRQIAGKIARRVRCWVHEGDRITAGQKFGMIKFGSRVEVLLPAAVEIAISVGQKVYGGQTVLGYWRDAKPAE